MMLAPIPMIGTVVALLLFVDIAALQLLGQQPDPEQQFTTDGSLVYVDGRVLHELRGESQSVVVLPGDLMEEPDILPDQASMQVFFDRQSQLAAVLGARGTVAVTDSGDLPLTPAPGLMPPAGFWIQLFVGNLGLLVGTAVLAFQRSNPAARHFFSTGLGLAISSIAAAVYSSRPLALDGEVFHLLSHVNHAGTLLFSAGFLSMMLHYPSSLIRVAVAPYWYGAMVFVFVLDLAGMVESTDVTRRAPAILALLLAAIVLVLQWRRSDSDPLTRQSLRWFVVVTLSGSAFFIAMIFFPPLLDSEPIVSQGAAFLAFLTIYIGLAVGVARYPLFDLQQYWVKTLIWLAGGMVVIAVNLLIVRMLGLSTNTAVWMTLASLLLIALPLRAAGARYVFNRAASNFQFHLPQIVARMSRSAETDISIIWREQVQEIFQPMEMSREKIQVVKPTVVKRGLGIVVPAIEGGASYHLMYADRGTRLFTSIDVSLVETLEGLFEMNLSAEKRVTEATTAERGRLRKDLHDTLGGRLLTILHTSPDTLVAEESRQAMGELREILAGIDAEPSLLGEALRLWEGQLRTQVEASGATFTWHCTDDLLQSTTSLEGRARFNLGQILREAVTNAVRHAVADQVAVHLRMEGGELRIVVENDGQVSDPETWQSGHGRRNIIDRAGELGALVRWEMRGGRVCLELIMGAGDLARPRSAGA